MTNASGDDPATGPVAIERSNTILYCQHWQPTVRFYREKLGLPVVYSNDWFVEFRVTEESFLSVADSARATVDDVNGQGITLSWRVADLAVARSRLVDRGLQPSEPRKIWNATAFHLFDPEGHRIELWSDTSEDV